MKQFSGRYTQKNRRPRLQKNCVGMERLEARSMMTASDWAITLAPVDRYTDPSRTYPVYMGEFPGLNIITPFKDSLLTVTPREFSLGGFEHSIYRINGQPFGVSNYDPTFFGCTFTLDFGGIRYDGRFDRQYYIDLVPRGPGDTTKPMVAIATGATALLPRQTTTITFSLSEPSYTFWAGDVRVQGGTLSQFQGEGTTYTALFTADSHPNGAAFVASVTVDTNRFTDAAANPNTASVCTFQVDPAIANFRYVAGADGITITGYTGTSTDVVVPGVLGGSPVTAIAAQAFRSTAIRTVSIPASVRVISPNAFENCASLRAVNVATSNRVYFSSDGVLYDRLSKTLLMCPRAKTGVVTVPVGIRVIGSDAFNGASISGVVVPPTVTAIGARAFQGARNAQSFRFQGTAPSVQSGAFTGVSKNAVVYYVIGTRGWGPQYGGVRTVGQRNGSAPGTPVLSPNPIAEVSRQLPKVR